MITRITLTRTNPFCVKNDLLRRRDDPDRVETAFQRAGSTGAMLAFRSNTLSGS